MKLLLTIDGISFYTNPTAIKRGVGQSVSVNNAAKDLLNELMTARKKYHGILQNTVGCGGTGYHGHNAQIYMME